MSCEVAVIGTPFLDLTFAGLDHLPNIGEEVVGGALHIGPGGTGMQAIGAARLGLTSALVAPLGSSSSAMLLKEMLLGEGVALVGDHDRPDGIPVTALLTTDEGVAMASVIKGGEPSAEEVASAGAEALILSLGRVRLSAPGAALYACTGGLELGHVTDETLRSLNQARAFVLNAAEARALTRHSDLEEAARALAGSVRTAIVTAGADGVIAAEGRQLVSVPAPQVDVVDATGAGDLFVAAYVWADLRGAALQERLTWASLYAGLSTRAPTALAGAISLKELLSEGAARGLEPPAGISGR
jgi:sugar/nucleoside kinase (ribokinase family)